MTDWNVHLLQAEGDLNAWTTTLREEIERARSAVAGLLVTPRLDILVQRGKRVIPETGMAGRALRPTLFTVTLDPDNPQFTASLADGALRRLAAHEAHHCLRMAGPSWGAGLGCALVNEGLAGRFVSHLFASAPEPWERAIDATTLQRLAPSSEQLAAKHYDRATWFFGKGNRPRWYGYTLGYDIVGRWLACAEEIDGAAWISVSAITVLDASVRTATYIG